MVDVSEKFNLQPNVHNYQFSGSPRPFFYAETVTIE